MKKVFFNVLFIGFCFGFQAQSLGDINKDLNDAKSRTKSLLQQINIISTGSNSNKERAADYVSIKASRITTILKRAHRNAGIEWKKISHKIKLGPGAGLQGNIYYAYQASEALEYNADRFNKVSNQDSKEKYFKKIVSSFNDLRKYINSSKNKLYEITGKLSGLELKEKEEEKRKKNLEIVRKDQELGDFDKNSNNSKTDIYKHNFGYITIKNIKYKTIKINEKIWMAENLNVKHFANGDLIPQSKTKEEWTKAGKEKKPTWCYIDFNSSNKKGIYYNGYAIKDPRGIAPEGWRIPSLYDWKNLASYMDKSIVNNGYEEKLKNTSGWSKFKSDKNGTNETGFSALPTASIDYKGELYNSDASYSSWWSSTIITGNKHFKNHIFSTWLSAGFRTKETLLTNNGAYISEGNCIRLIKNN